MIRVRVEVVKKRNLESNKMMDAKYKKSSSALRSSLGEKNFNLARFSDYFVICGLDLENGLEAECYTGKNYETLGDFETMTFHLYGFQTKSII